MNLFDRLSSEKQSFKDDFKNFNLLNTDKRFLVDWNDRFPCLDDKTSNTEFDTHYVYHPAWAARILQMTNPNRHVDISSTLHFCSIISAFMPVDFYDYRPANLTLSNLTSQRADLTNLHFDTNSIKSLSCMHTIEHIGLGRYGDPIDPQGDIKAMNEIKRVVSQGGSILFVTPVGRPRIQFNAHRIYSPNMICDYFLDFELRQFSLVTDSGDFLWDCSVSAAMDQNYGCGCFWFVKN